MNISVLPSVLSTAVNTVDPNAQSLFPASPADPNALTPSFSQTLEKAFTQVNTLQNRAADASQAFATGQASDIHSVMIASEQATIALQLATQVRNKVVEAYQEVMKISM